MLFQFRTVHYKNLMEELPFDEKDKKHRQKLTILEFFIPNLEAFKLPEPTPIQYDIADYLANGSTRCIISAFRGVGKSWITASYVLMEFIIR